MTNELPAVGSTWEHKNGNTYEVVCVANGEGITEERKDEYPVMISYRRSGTTRPVYGRLIPRWHPSMTLVDLPEPEGSVFERVINHLFGYFFGTEQPYVRDGLVVVGGDEGIAIPEDQVAYLYVVTVFRNYGRNNVLKIGYSNNVESHLCFHLSRFVRIDTERSFKVMLPLHEAVALKADLKSELHRYHNVCPNSRYQGRTDWYDRIAYSELRSLVESKSMRCENIDWDLYEEYKEKQWVPKTRYNPYKGK